MVRERFWQRYFIFLGIKFHKSRQTWKPSHVSEPQKNIQLEQDSRPPYGGNMRGGCWMVDFSWHQIYVYYTIVFPPNIEINEGDLYGVLMVFCFTLIIQESVFEWISKKHGVHAASAPQKVCS